ncbi:ABC transporter permease [Halomarina pelagica]|uniref:ABC transporter permease n=1 Tax=Halomarina pelagica TaxID=2961599 RepID=UPI0020C45722|nr:ABC transporter permease [Halomarina sp. BND7]
MSTVSTRLPVVGGLTRGQRVRVAQTLLVGSLLATVEFAPRLGLIGPTTLIPLSEMVGELVRLLVSGELTPHIVQTFSAVFGAFALAAVTGLPAGVVLWRVDRLKRVLDPYLLIYYAVPFFAFYPLLISVMGLGILPILTIAWGFSVVIMVTNTASGLAEIPEVYVQAGRDMNLTDWQLLRYVYLPASVPYVFTGLKLGFIYALIGTIASEFILAESGLGWLISYDYNNFDVRGMYAAMLLVVLLALAVNATLTAVERRLYRRVRR